MKLTRSFSAVAELLVYPSSVQYTLRSLIIRTPTVHLDPSGISSFITQVRDDVVSEMIFFTSIINMVVLEDSEVKKNNILLHEYCTKIQFSVHVFTARCTSA